MPSTFPFPECFADVRPMAPPRPARDLDVAASDPAGGVPGALPVRGERGAGSHPAAVVDATAGEHGRRAGGVAGPGRGLPELAARGGAGIGAGYPVLLVRARLEPGRRAVRAALGDGRPVGR